MQNAYKAILFDLGGVLIDIDYTATERAFRLLGVEDFQKSYTQFAQNELFDRFECGEVSPQHFVNLLLPLTRQGTSPNEVVAAWNAMIGAFPTKKLEVLRQLKVQQIPLFLLSNTNALHMVEVTQSLKKATTATLTSFFNEVYLSHEIGQRKPHRATFEWVCEQMKCVPSEVLFIDDSPQHIKGAQQAGLQTHFYKEESDFYALFS